jgi:hypothetical protein
MAVNASLYQISVPRNAEISDEEVGYIIEAVSGFYKKSLLSKSEYRGRFLRFLQKF